MEPHAFRLLPGDDLYDGITKYVNTHQIHAGVILCGVGSLTVARIRLAADPLIKTWTKNFEIVSITGTASTLGHHIHISISDETGATVGGHLFPGCTVRTTAEIVIGNMKDTVFTREHCEKSGWPELVVYKKDKANL